MSVTISGTAGITTSGLTATTVDATSVYNDKNNLPISLIAVNTTAVVGTHYVLTASLALTLPAAPEVGDSIKVTNRSGTTTATILRNGLKIMGIEDDITIDDVKFSFTMVYSGTTQGWVFI